jgi:hypothetical protein
MNAGDRPNCLPTWSLQPPAPALYRLAAVGAGCAALTSGPRKGERGAAEVSDLLPLLLAQSAALAEDELCARIEDCAAEVNAGGNRWPVPTVRGLSRLECRLLTPAAWCAEHVGNLAWRLNKAKVQEAARRAEWLIGSHLGLSCKLPGDAPSAPSELRKAIAALDTMLPQVGLGLVTIVWPAFRVTGGTDAAG